MKDTKLSIDSIEIVMKIKERNNSLYNGFIKIYEQVEPLLNTRISQVFKHYTLHDVNHSLRIMDYMGKLVPNLDNLNEFELVLLAYSALLHDIGMAASEEEIKDIKNGDLVYGDINYESVLKKFNGNQDQALQDYIRIVHAYRSSEYIKKNLKTELVIPNMSNTSFEDQVALICQSHTEDITWIEQNLIKYGQKGEFVYNSQFCAIILRLADILDFDSQRTPPILFNAISPQGISKNEWIQHFSIENKNKIKQSDNGYKIIELHGRCSNPTIHRKILSYINWINNEIDNANYLSQNYPEKYRILLHPKVYDFIRSEGYTISDLKFKVNYNQITKLLMGENLYGDKKFGLRELIQNAIDACNLKKEILDKNYEFGEEKYKGFIKVILDKHKNQVIIKDNGIGMNLHILKNYFLKLGASFYNSDDYALKGYTYNPIGNYGIGFLACFMLSDEVKVKTRHMKDSELYEVDINKYDEFVCINHNKEFQNEGTDVILKYDQFMNVWEEPNQVEEFLNTHFLTDEIKIQYINKAEEKIKDINNFIFKGDPTKDVNLSNYLNGIEGIAILISDINHIFDTNIDELSFKGEPIVFDGESLHYLDEHEFQLSNFIDNNIMNVINFPKIEYGDELDKIVNVIDDIEDAFENYIDKNNASFITVIAEKDLMDESSRGFVKEDEEILPDLHLDDFYDYGHDRNASTIIELEEKLIYHLEELSLFLTIEQTKKTFRHYRYNDIKSSLYVRNVFVEKFELDVSYKLSNLKIKDLTINVINNDVKPNVTRNNLNETDLKLIKNAIYIAICFFIYDNLTDTMKKQTLIGYIRKYHKFKNKFLKEKYENLLFE